MSDSLKDLEPVKSKATADLRPRATEAVISLHESQFRIGVIAGLESLETVMRAASLRLREMQGRSGSRPLPAHAITDAIRLEAYNFKQELQARWNIKTGSPSSLSQAEPSSPSSSS